MKLLYLIIDSKLFIFCFDEGVRRDREHSSSRRSRDDRRSGSREMEREPRDDRRRSRDDDRRRDYRDERITGKKRSDYSRGPESDRKRSRHH